MKVNEALELHIPIGRNGKFGSVAFKAAELPEHVHDHIYLYGIRQILNDACSDKKDGEGQMLTDAEILAIAQAKYDQLKSGELRKRGEAEIADPIEREAFKIAKEKITLAFKKVGLWPTKGENKFQEAVNARRLAMRQDKIDAEIYIQTWLDANPQVRKAAAKIVEARKVDLEDAGLM